MIEEVKDQIIDLIGCKPKIFVGQRRPGIGVDAILEPLSNDSCTKRHC
jgi:GTP-binding protein LepA